MSGLFNKSLPYELKIIIKSSVISGGGLANDSFVEVSIDGVLFETTESAPSPPEWNKTISKRFSKIESSTPIIISFSVYKKRWTSHGYKLVGTVQFPLSDLYGIINTGVVEKSFDLVSNRRNLTLCGSLLLGLELTQSLKRRSSIARDAPDVKKPTNKTERSLEGMFASVHSFIQPALEFRSVYMGLNVIGWLVVLALIFLFLHHFQMRLADQKLSELERILETMEILLQEHLAELQKNRNLRGPGLWS
jgi:hypothetical protein